MRVNVLRVVVILLLVPWSEGLACTLFGAIGSRVEGGGTLIGKTRDRFEPLEQVFIEVSPKTGYRYRGITTKGKTAVTSGINEKGLVVVSAAASNMKREGSVTSVGRLLAKNSSVDEAIEMIKKGEVQGPIHFLVGDSRKIALLEILDGKHHAVLQKNDDVLYHTNHFILPEMKALNPRIGKSSEARLNRIEALSQNGWPFTQAKFIAFAKDHANGPGNLSICRHVEAKDRSSEKTVSAAVFYLPREGSPELWVALAQPCETPFEKR